QNHISVKDGGGAGNSCCRNNLLDISSVAARLLGSSAVMLHSREPFLRARFIRQFLAIICLLLAFVAWMPLSAEAAGNHRGPAVQGVASSHVRQYKVDGELSRRADRLTGVTRVIVTLQPGAELPQELKKFSHSGKLGIINGHVIDLPNGVLKQFAAH